jgi:hypothetical protein
VDTTDLHVIFVGDFLMELGVFHELREIDMYGCSQTGSHVGGASRNVTKMLVVGEFSFFFDLVGSGSKSSENLTDVGSLLHGDDSELILFVNPDEESLSIVVEDTSSIRPVSL